MMEKGLCISLDPGPGQCPFLHNCSKSPFQHLELIFVASCFPLSLLLPLVYSLILLPPHFCLLSYPTFLSGYFSIHFSSLTSSSYPYPKLPCSPCQAISAYFLHHYFCVRMSNRALKEFMHISKAHAQTLLKDSVVPAGLRAGSTFLFSPPRLQ